MTRLHFAHLAFDFRAGYQRSHRIDHQNIDRAGADQRIGDLERLLTCIGLGDQQVVQLDAELAGIDRVERMLGIDEAADTALLLGLGDRVQGQRGLAGGFRPVDLDHAALRKPTNAKRDVEAERAGGDRLDFDGLLVLAKPHDRALAEGALDLGERGVQSLGLVHGRAFNKFEIRLSHRRRPYGMG